MHGHKKLRQFLRFAIIFFVVTSFQTFGYVSYNKSILQQQSILAFREQSEMLRLNFLQRVERQFALLETLASYAAKEDDISKENFDAFREHLSLLTGYDEMNIIHIELAKIVYNGDNPIAVSDSNSFKVQEGGNITFLEDENEATRTLVFSVPVFREDGTKDALIAYVDGNKLFKDINKSFFDGKGSFYVTDQQGNILGAEEQDLYFYGEKTVFSFLSSKKIVDNINNYEGVIKYREAHDDWFSSFQPLGFQDLYVLSLVPDYFTPQLQNKFYTIQMQQIMVLILINAVGYAVLYCVIRKTMKALEKENNCFKTAEEAAGIISFVGNYRKDRFDMNEVFEKQVGRKPVIQKISDFAKPHPFIIEEDQEIFRKMGLDLMHGKETGNAQYRIMGKDGNIQWQQFVYRVWYDRHGAPMKCYGMIIPIDQQMKVISKLQMQVEKDPLTGVLNRTAFEIYVNSSVNSGFDEDHHALLLLDLDDFKQINDGFGHVLGDHVLVATADILKACVRNSDYVGRLGGDEFAVFLKGVNKEQAARKAGEICEALEREEIKSNEAAVTCSIGIACFPLNGLSFNELYQCADRALYKVKGSGKNSFSFSE